MTYDLWASMGNEGWGWEDVFPYFKKVSQALLHALNWFDRILEYQIHPSVRRKQPLRGIRPLGVFSRRSARHRVR